MRRTHTVSHPEDYKETQENEVHWSLLRDSHYSSAIVFICLNKN